MSVHLVPPTALQCGDVIFMHDNHEWLVKYIEGPDKIGCMDVSLIDAEGHEKVELIVDPVRLVM